MNTSDALPKCEIIAVPTLGVNPKILLRAQEHAFSSKSSMTQKIYEAKKKKNLPSDASRKQVFLFLM
jgi:hypothetical protein